MKIRTGFVSNSSSSSFLVGFKQNNIPKSAKEMQKMLFGDTEILYYYEKTYNAEEVAKRVWEDFKDAKPVSRRKMVEILDKGNIENVEFSFEKECDKIVGLEEGNKYSKENGQLPTTLF